MLSSLILAAYLSSAIFLIALTIMAVARWLGSSRATVGAGLLAEVIISAVNFLILAVAFWLIHTNQPASPAMAGIFVFAVQCCVAFGVLLRVFRLSLVKTICLLATYLVASIVISLAGAMIVRPYLTESYVVSSSSMSPTLEVGDHILACRLLTARRGDHVAYWNNEAIPTVFCHRLVGLPGERLRFEGGELYVNDERVTAPPVISGRLHASPVDAPPDIVRYRDGMTITLGPDEYFLVGDNVDRSLDSRLQGPTDRSSLVGVIDLRYWPLNRLQMFR